ncbi:MAG: hypothetical protein LBU12_08540 [Deltaproteobacteria bacterium]|jgi:hypothetical protein|nr:hypothetical protein [Deltaproteobacteria bacterium]
MSPLNGSAVWQLATFIRHIMDNNFNTAYKVNKNEDLEIKPLNINLISNNQNFINNYNNDIYSHSDNNLPDWEVYLSLLKKFYIYSKSLSELDIISWNKYYTSIDDLNMITGYRLTDKFMAMPILDNFNEISTCACYLERTKTIESIMIKFGNLKFIVPTEKELLICKVFLMLKRNLFRDYIDFIEICHNINNISYLVLILQSLDNLYPQKCKQSALHQLIIQLSEMKPYDLLNIDKKQYLNRNSIFKSWKKLVNYSEKLSFNIFDSL